jgi:1,2-phenylacetyl-CoA epoxidase PaaB subunit
MNATNKKNSKDYNNGKIYQVLNRINNEVYVGSTCQQLSSRMALHRRYSIKHNGKLYDEMRRLGNEYFYIVLIENYPCGNKDDLTSRQHFYIKERGTLNNNTTQPDDKNPDEVELHQPRLMNKDSINVKEMVNTIQTIIDRIEHQSNTTPVQIKRQVKIHQLELMD